MSFRKSVQNLPHTHDLYLETHVLQDELADAIAVGTRKEFMESLTTSTTLEFASCR
jgi:hypothetical protein